MSENFVTFCVACTKGVTKEEMWYIDGRVFHAKCFAKHGKDFRSPDPEIAQQSARLKIDIIQLKNQLAILESKSKPRKKTTKRKSKKKSKKKLTRRTKTKRKIKKRITKKKTKRPKRKTARKATRRKTRRVSTKRRTTRRRR